MRYSILAALAAMAVPAAAHADWQFTKWGMTPAAVVAASKGQVAPLSPEDSRARSLDDGSRTAKLGMAYSAGAFGFRTTFGFDGMDRLVTVELKLSQGDGEALIAALKDQYGKAETEEEDAVKKYHWRSSADLIDVIQIGNTVWINYLPRPTRAKTGL